MEDAAESQIVSERWKGERLTEDDEESAVGQITLI